PETPEELRRQFGRVRQIVDALNIPVFELDGYEADDLLGTISLQAASQGIDTVIVSGDNDMLQVISPQVKVLFPQRSFGDITLYDTDAVHQKYGIAPERIPDFKGLKGDPSDNIPGVSGVGEKTATRLIQDFGSIEGIYQHIDEVTPAKLKETLLAQHETATQSKRLATIVTNAPVSFDPACCQSSAIQPEKLEPLFRELEFFLLLNKLPEMAPSAHPAVPASPRAVPDHTIVASLPALDELAGRLAQAASVVIRPVAAPSGQKTRGPAEMAGLAVSIPDDRAYYIPMAHSQLGVSPQLGPDQVLDRLRPVLSSPRVARLAHGGKDIVRWLADHGADIVNLEFDTEIAAYLLGEKSLDLEVLALNKLNAAMVPAPPSAKGGLFAAAAPAEIAARACDEATAIGRLRPLLQKALEEKQLSGLFHDVEMPLLPVLARMERIGVALDSDIMRQMSQKLGKQLVELEQEIYGHAGHRFNINSPRQLGDVLFGELSLPGGRKTKTGYSTDASILDGLRDAHPIIKPILEYRQLMKLKSTYIDALPVLVNPDTGRLHTSFNQTATATGRLSSSDPNLQNIPVRGDLGKQVRQAFVARPPALLLSADYSQIELRILAHLSQDPRLLAAFRHDEDIHAATAAEVFGVEKLQVTPDMRRVAKVVNFGIIYGMSDYGLEQATELTRQQAAGFIAAYFLRYPAVQVYLESTRQQAREQGYVQTLLGRRRYIPELKSGNRQRALRSRMILQVHDELLFEVPETELDEMKALAKDTMSRAMDLSVPLKVDIKMGKNWGEMG
ncbi:MAG: DNA polymerase I, partial [Chloroflexi bacterium]|nr:DNA polymerase I [Chloroflexota bacterium]